MDMNIINFNLKELKSDQSYKTWKDQFSSFVQSKDRTPHQLHYYLVYDIDDKTFMIKSEYEVTYNQIVMQTALIPSKKDIKLDIVIKDYEYK
jgi:hypothetical protein